MKRTLKGTKSSAQTPPMDNESVRRAAQNMDESTMGTIQDAINRYGGKSQDELMRELKNYRNSGGMDERDLENVAQKLMPMLTEEQQRRLFHVMGELKR